MEEVVVKVIIVDIQWFSGLILLMFETFISFSKSLSTLIIN